MHKLASSTTSLIPVWYETFRGHLAAMASRLGYRKEEAEDLLNGFFLELLEKNIDGATVTNPQAYLSIAFRRKLIDYNRSHKQKMFVVTSDLPETQQQPSEAFLLEQVQYNQELVRQIKTACGKLPERCRKVIYLKYYVGLSTEQISQQTGLSKRSVYNNLFEGIKILRAEMSRLSPGVPYAALLSILPIVFVP